MLFRVVNHDGVPMNALSVKAVLSDDLALGAGWTVDASGSIEDGVLGHILTSPNVAYPGVALRRCFGSYYYHVFGSGACAAGHRDDGILGYVPKSLPMAGSV